MVNPTALLRVYTRFLEPYLDSLSVTQQLRAEQIRLNLEVYRRLSVPAGVQYLAMLSRDLTELVKATAAVSANNIEK